MTALRQLPLFAPARPRLPATRGDCIDGPRPCPHSTCRHALDGGECSLDLAEEPRSTIEIAGLLGLSRERIRQIESEALSKLRRRGAVLGEYIERHGKQGSGGYVTKPREPDEEGPGSGGDRKQAIGRVWAILDADEDDAEERTRTAQERAWRLYSERSDRRIGELTAELEKVPQARGNQHAKVRSTDSATKKSTALAELGISKQGE